MCLPISGHVITISGMGAVAGPKPLLLERDAELARLSALLGNAQAGSGSVVAVSGPAGIGKTALLTAVHRLAGDRGFRSLRARGRELEAGMAFSVVRQLLEQPVLSASAGERRRLLAGPARAGAGALGLSAGDSPASEFAAVHGLYWLCVNLADHQPLLLTVDDLQWVDGPSLSWLAYLGPRAAESPVLMVLTVREDDPRGRANSVAAAADDSSVHRMGLSALSMASVAALVRAELGPTASPAFCSACWELAGGNPLYVRELLAAAGTEGLSGAEDDVTALRALASSAVGALVLGRLARLGPDAVSLAGALAVLGSQTEVGVAAELAGLDPAAAELTADELAAAQILAPARPLDFFHPVIGEAVHADLALGARRLAHRRAAAILDRAGAADRVAAHLLATGPAGDAWVVQRLSAAAGIAGERGQLRMAQGRREEALQDFLACGERCERLGIVDTLYEWRSEAAIAHAALGHSVEARQLARAVVRTARGFGGPRALGVALRAAGLSEGGERGLGLLGEAITVLERSQAPVELARALTDHGAALRRAGQRTEARAQLERGLDLAHHYGARRIAGQARAELIALTASELRVARLAAAGKTNREIAQELFITTKTASAHLSRVYRKLDVTRRDQLAEALVNETPAFGRQEAARAS